MIFQPDEPADTKRNQRRSGAKNAGEDTRTFPKRNQFIKSRADGFGSRCHANLLFSYFGQKYILLV